MTFAVPVGGWLVAKHTKAAWGRLVISSTDNVFGSSGGEFDRPRQTVQRAAQVEHRVVDHPRTESRTLRGGSVGEQLDGVRQGQGREFEHCLTVNVKRNLTGAQNPEPGAASRSPTASFDTAS